MPSHYMNPYLAGFLLGLLLVATIFVTGRGLGASGAYRSVLAASVTAVAPTHAAGNEFYSHAAGDGSNPLKSWLVFEVLGVLVGAFLSGVVSDRLQWIIERPPHVRVRTRLAAALIGGALFGAGAQLARGCTSGAALSGMAVMSFGGIVTMLAIFGSAYGTAYFVRRLWIAAAGGNNGPLVPEVVTNELNLVVALLVGVAFGFILEQAGFSSSRKLTGLFYGTDFTVLRVFFTAGSTALAGVLLLADLGVLDASVIYVNPTFLYAAIVGGLIMGVGFVVGGYCPGTSFCGAAVGRIDGLAFVLGGLVGAFAFGEAFPRVQSLYLAKSMGEPTMPSMLGIAPGIFALLLIVVAVVAFVATTKIELRVNAESTARLFPVRRQRLAAAALLGLGAVLAWTPDYKARLLANASDETVHTGETIARITPDELAFRMLDGDASFTIVDVRPAAAFAATGLPGAVNIPLTDMFGKTWADVLSRGRTRKVFVADAEVNAEQAARLALLLGYRNVGVLVGGMSGFWQTMLQARAPASDQDDPEVAQFRLEAGARIAALIKARSARKPVHRTVKRITGGCGV
jgi:rhodanese-related sulfurtransferase/uncharacterized membrane protein YedE/YeeE